jgi:dUTP pyrophosphatase
MTGSVAQALPVPLLVLPHGRGLPLPAYATAGSAGLDLVAAVGSTLEIPPGGRVAVPTGLALALPEAWEAQVRPRSGLALKHGVTVLNSPGTIDSDYRGEVRVILANLGSETVSIARGDRIAQLVVAPVQRIAWQRVEELPSTGRGSDGFGSTGV